MRRKQRLFVPVTEDEKKMILALTAESGLTIASHIRQTIREQYRTKVRAAMKEQHVSK
jgi:hypothetical protein